MHPPAPHTHDLQRMQCMEVWGGNQAFDAAVSMPGLDAWVYSKPYGEKPGQGSGGDVYYVSACATGRINRLLLADVSGHGAAVHDAAAQLRALMRQYVNYVDQGAFVSAMNHQFLENSAAHCFATAVVTTFFAPTRYLSLCNAGHPAPLWYRAKEKTWSFLEALEGNESRPTDDPRPRNIPLGIVDLEDYDQFGIHLDPGDLVLCHTDSLIESKDPTGEFLGLEGLLRIVRTIDGTRPAAVIPALLSAIAEEYPGNLTQDDVTLLLFRPSGRPDAGFRQRLYAPLRLLGGLTQAVMRGEKAPLPDLNPTYLAGAVLPAFNRLWRPRSRRSS